MEPMDAVLPASAPPRAPRSAAPWNQKGPGSRPDAAEAAQQVEALFISQLIQAMRRTVPENGLLSGGKGEEIMRSMQDESLAQEMARRGGLGLSAHILGGLHRLSPSERTATADGHK